jgi:hypothetical protein
MTLIDDFLNWLDSLFTPKATDPTAPIPMQPTTNDMTPLQPVTVVDMRQPNPNPPAEPAKSTPVEPVKSTDLTPLTPISPTQPDKTTKTSTFDKDAYIANIDPNDPYAQAYAQQAEQSAEPPTPTTYSSQSVNGLYRGSLEYSNNSPPTQINQNVFFGTYNLNGQSYFIYMSKHSVGLTFWCDRNGGSGEFLQWLQCVQYIDANPNYPTGGTNVHYRN